MSLIFFRDEGFEIQMQLAGGRLRQPVQKPAASSICAEGTNAPNPSFQFDIKT